MSDSLSNIEKKINQRIQELKYKMKKANQRIETFSLLAGATVAIVILIIFLSK